MGLGIVGMWLVDTDLRGGENRVSGEAGGQELQRKGDDVLGSVSLLEGLRSQHFVSLPTLEGPPS